MFWEGGFDGNMGVTPREQAVPYAAQGMFGRIAVGAEMRKEHGAQGGVGDLLEQGQGLGVREMALSAGNSLLERPGSQGVVQERFVVIGLQNQRLAGLEPLPDQFGSHAHVGDDADSGVGSGRRFPVDDESDGFIGVMGYGEGFHSHVAYVEGGAGRENLPGGRGGFAAGGQGVGGAAVGVDGDRMLTGQDVQSDGMIAMFVGEANGVNVGEGNADFLQFARGIARAQAGIH